MASRLRLVASHLHVSLQPTAAETAAGNVPRKTIVVTGARPFTSPAPPTGLCLAAAADPLAGRVWRPGCTSGLGAALVENYVKMGHRVVRHPAPPSPAYPPLTAARGRC